MWLLKVRRGLIFRPTDGQQSLKMISIELFLPDKVRKSYDKEHDLQFKKNYGFRRQVKQ